MNAYTRDFPLSIVPGIEPGSQEATRALRDAFGKFATGVAVVTCASDLGPVAITVNSFSSISLEPALIMWAAGKTSKRYPAFAKAGHYAVHILAADQKELCDTVSKNGFALADMDHNVNEHGVPLLDSCLARFECRSWSVQDAGDHALLLGEVQRAGLRSGDALAFFGGKFTNLAQP